MRCRLCSQPDAALVGNARVCERVAGRVERQVERSVRVGLLLLLLVLVSVAVAVISAVCRVVCKGISKCKLEEGGCLMPEKKARRGGRRDRTGSV